MNLVEDRGCSLGKCYLFFLVFLFFCVECDSRVGVQENRIQDGYG